jgi:hypothetical protein
MIYSKIQDLRNVFLETNEQASDGKKVIDKYLKKNALDHLLRHHDEEDIEDDETWLRDDVDYFLEYFSFLSLAHITGYLRLVDLHDEKEEINYYLSLEPLRLYYYEYYEVELPQVLREVLLYGREFAPRKERSQEDELLFHRFHALNQRIDNDDVNQFLWFLDGGRVNGYGIDDLQDALRKTKRCFKIRNQKKNNALRQSVRGFFLYLDFLLAFEQFLNAVADTLDKAAYWVYHGYWFRKIRGELRSSIKLFFDGLAHFLKKADQGPEEIKKMRMSERIYLATIKKIVFADEYEEYFADYTSKWRKEIKKKMRAVKSRVRKHSSGSHRKKRTIASGKAAKRTIWRGPKKSATKKIFRVKK